MVYKVSSRLDGNQYVLKKIDCRSLSEKEKCKTLQEIEIMGQSRHPNIIELYFAFYQDHSLFIVMEFADGGDLA